MPALLLTGDWQQRCDLLAPLYAAGHTLILAAADALLARCAQTRPDMLLAALGPGLAVARVAGTAERRAIPWVAWNRDDDPASALAARGAGARAVLPAAIGGPALVGAVRDALARAAPPAPTVGPAGAVERRYAREALIMPERDAVLEVRAGVVALSVLHPDGTEVLLGLYGPGQILVGHPEDSCCLQLVAHTDAVVGLRSWRAAAARPGFPEQLRARLRQMEAWSAAQARPGLDQRLLGILGLLAEQFGVPHPEGTLIDVRITHAQLAAAVGATRTTVTRLLGDLRGRGLLATAGTGGGERLCLRRWDGGDHGFRAREAAYADSAA